MDFSQAPTPQPDGDYVDHLHLTPVDLDDFLHINPMVKTFEWLDLISDIQQLQAEGKSSTCTKQDSLRAPPAVATFS